MMSDITRKDLDAAVDRLTGHINNKFDDHKIHHDRIDKKLDNAHEEIYGNGGHGLKDRMTQVETRYGTVKKLVVWLGGLIVSGLGLVGIKINL